MTRAPARADAERRDWTIQKVVPGGEGMARLEDGRVGFADGAFPGDVIRPVAIEARKGHVRATRWSLVVAATTRVNPPCKVAADCGGCDWMALDCGAQRVAKQALLREALERTAGVRLGEDVRVDAFGPDLGYRSRTRFHVDAGGAVGYFARGTQKLVEIPSCIACRSEISLALDAIRRVPRASLSAFSEIDVRVAERGPRVAVHLVSRVPGGAAPAVKAVRNALPSDWTLCVDGVSGTVGREQRYPLPLDVELFAPVGVFTQVNWDVNVALVEAVIDGARTRKVRRFLDAYAGAGNFSLPLLAADMSGIGVERDARAVDAARRAAAARGLPSDGFLEGDAATRLAECVRAHERLDLILLDPPRAGARECLASVVALSPPFVVYCSCDPATLARDIRLLRDAGYGLDEIRGFDMFPSTHHLETLAWLSRPG